MTDEFTMPVTPAHGRGKVGFTWAPTEEHHAQARRNHGQGLAHLKQRGGIAWPELRWILLGLPYGHDRVKDEATARQTCEELYPQDATAP